MEFFPNLAKRYPTREDINRINVTMASELIQAGISILNLKGPVEDSRVPYSFIGVLGSKKDVLETNTHSRLFGGSMIGHFQDSFEFVFTRNHYYWRVKGYVPLPVAKEIYSTELGRTKVRAGYDCGCRPPETWAMRKLVCGMQVVSGYDIDNQEGLNLFVDTVKKHKLYRE